MGVIAMKMGTTCRLAVELNINLDNIAKVEFCFSQTMGPCARILKTCAYPDDCARREDKNVIDVIFTAEETRRFKPGQRFFMDTRVTLADGYMAETPIVGLVMNPTLFEED